MTRVNKVLLRVGGLALATALAKMAYSEKARLHRNRGKFLRGILQNLPDGFTSVDADWSFTYINPAAERMFAPQGIEGAALIGRHVFEVLPEAPDTEIGQAFVRCMTERATVEIESFYPPFKRWYLMRHFPSPDGGASVIVQDVTARKQSEDKLAQLAHELQSVSDAMPALISYIDAEGRYRFNNKAFVTWFGREPHEIHGKHVRDVIGEAAFERIRPQFEAVLTGKNVDFENEISYPDGSTRYVHSEYVPDVRPNGSVAGFHALTTNITASKRTEQALQATDRRKDEFLAMLAHELRNPLAPIRNAAEILWLISDEPARVRETSEIIVRQARHMNELVDDLLDVSRVTRGLVTLQTEPLDLRSVITAAVEQSLPLLDSRRHQLQFDLPVEPAHVNGDRVRLTQIFSNLVNNAAKYTLPGGTIRISIVEDGGEIEVDVVDTGEGIEPDLLPHVFDLFAQGHRTPDRTQGGLGIGLSLVKTLVQLHRGTIEAASEGAGHGSRFTVRLPRSTEVERRQDLSDPATSSTTPLRSMRLLVVDDNVDAAESLAMMLELDGHTVFKAHDARSAVERAQRERPDAMLLDIGLPDIDGYELARRLRALPETRNAKLIAVSGYGQQEDRRRAEDAGFDDYLVKPVEFDSLRAMLSVDRIEA